MLREWKVDGAKIIAANYGLNAATEFRNKVLEECICVAAIGSTYHFYSDVERDDEQVETRIGADGVLRKSQKHLKANIVKELIRGIEKSLPIMKLAAMDHNVKEYLLYCMLYH